MKTIDPEVSVIFASVPKTSGEREPISSAPGLDVRRFDQELRDWPPLEWPEEPIRPATPSRRAVWGVRVLSLLGVAALVIFFWLATGSRETGRPVAFLAAASLHGLQGALVASGVGELHATEV